MDLSVGNMLYLSLVIVSFCFFMAVLGVTSWRCNRKDPAKRAEPLNEEESSLKTHGDKLSHAVDAAA